MDRDHWRGCVFLRSTARRRRLRTSTRHWAYTGSSRRVRGSEIAGGERTRERGGIAGCGVAAPSKNTSASGSSSAGGPGKRVRAARALAAGRLQLFRAQFLDQTVGAFGAEDLLRLRTEVLHQ